jgi:hypothetical protein
VHQETCDAADEQEEHHGHHGIARWTESGIDPEPSREEPANPKQVLPEPRDDGEADQHRHDEKKPANDVIAHPLVGLWHSILLHPKGPMSNLTIAEVVD